MEDKKNEKETDRRNLYLLDEGSIDLRHVEGIPEKDIEKRARSKLDKQTKLKNPLFYVSSKRLSVKNLGKHVHGKMLRKIFNEYIYIYNISHYRATKKAIKNHLVNIEDIKPQLRPTTPNPEIKIVQSMVLREAKEGSLSKGSGFVEFTEHYHALSALREVNNNPKYWWLSVSGQNKDKNKDEIPTMTSRLIVEFAIENHNTERIKRMREEKKKEIEENGIENNTKKDDERPRKRARKSGKF